MQLKEQKTTLQDRIKNVAKRFFGAPSLVFSHISPFGVPPTTRIENIIGHYRNVVYQCITTISDDVSQAEHFALVEGRNGLEKKTHPILELFERPNPEQTKQEFLEATQSFLESTGECFWYFALGEQTGRPKEVWIIRPDRIRIMVKDGEVAGYKVRTKDNPEGVMLMPKEVYHLKLFNPNDPFRGLGPLQAGLAYVQTEEFASEFTRNFLYNNATPSGVISIPGDVSRDAYNKFKRNWRQGVSGVKNAGSIATIRGAEAKFTKVGSSLEDIDLEKIKNITEDKILRMFKVPKPLLGDYDATGLGRAALESLEYIYMKRTIEPKISRYDRAFENLAERFYRERITIGHESVIPQDKEFELKRNTEAVRKWLSVDEIRQLEGYEKVGDNQLYIGFNEVPVEGVETEKKKKWNIKVSKPKEKQFDVSDKSDNAPQEVFRRNTIDVTTERYITRVQKEARAFLDEQEDAVLDRFALKNVTAKNFKEGFDIPEESEKMTSRITPIVRELAEKVGIQAAEFVGATGYVLPEALERTMRDHILRMANNFNRDTADKLAKTLAEGFSNGESTGKLKKRVGSIYKEAKGWRNERIARSESHWTATKVTEDAYIQNGVKYKQWYANPGACEYCSAVDGRKVATSQTFFNSGTPIEGTEGGTLPTDYEDIDTSHLHPNCRCQLLPITENISQQVRELPKEDLIKEQLLDEISGNIKENLKEQVEDIEKKISKNVEKTNEKYIKEFDKLFKRLDEVLDEEENPQSKD